ncbi:DUF2785 domain-containing protein [Nocardioides sp. GY 10113]|uniref:DUF2785 domain-containing protein n=1 Tax=Nocardioides sp. GY 10113 TaxID=2569761 RepID=UPI0010A7DD04|nr:DUF2785 domain-containing protein [Nocardioides sp. GY 10113]TIC88806.1 DUF2785 domain-containing protein [Nocardioides sp. GY 10113]
MLPDDWLRLRAADYPVPPDAPLADLTADLTELLGHPDAELRDHVARPALHAWIRRGVYDDLLVGLGDGIATGLGNGLGQSGTASVFRRVASAEVLAACIARDTRRPLLAGGKVLDWADRIATWLLAERDLRGHVPGQGWAQAVCRGADALAVVAASPHCGRAELGVLLEVLGERVTAPGAIAWESDEADHLAGATLRLLRRDLLPLDRVEMWVATIGDRAFGISAGSGGPDPVAANVDAFLRALYLQLALAPKPPAIRSDLLLTVVAVLRELHPEFLG